MTKTTIAAIGGVAITAGKIDGFLGCFLAVVLLLVELGLGGLRIHAGR